MAGSVSQRVVVEQAELNEKQSTGRMALFNEDGTPFTGGGGGADETRLLPEGGTVGQVVKKTAEGVEWSADANTTPPTAGTAAELQAGTVTATRVWSPKVIHDEIKRQIAAIPPA